MKKIIFLTASRADYGKLKTLIINLQKNKKFKVYIFVTGMHNLKKFGSTWMKIKLKKYDNIKNVFRFNNQNNNDTADSILAKTIVGFSKYVKKIKPDLIIVHGDRIEPLACSTVGVLNNFRTAHIEGGEVSGAVDEIIRHSISKLSHIHFVTNSNAKKRLVQMGELSKNIFTIGSPDIDIMLSKNLPSISTVKKHYNIKFENYGIGILHSVTTDIINFKNNIKIFVNSLKKSQKQFVLIYPNNDLGSNYIFNEYKKLSKYKNIRLLPSMAFESYLTLLKNSNLIIGNSSSGIMEAPIFGTPTINIGNRQNNRSGSKTICDVEFNQTKIIKLINYFFRNKLKYKRQKEFGAGKSFKLFERALKSKYFWNINVQKTFKEIN
jgi:UDP-N-acetylglucosamine 2-epimerase (hydrolysing)